MEQDLMVGVKVALKNKDGNILLLRRSERGYAPLAGQWDLPGGRIDRGKTLFENLQREILEETGLRLESEPVLLAAQDIIDDSRHVVRLTYSGRIDGNVILNEEHTAYRWFSKEEMENLSEELDRFTRQILHLI